MLEKVNTENRTLKKIQRRTERGLNDAKRAHGDLPTIIRRYTEEIRVQKEKLRRYKSKFEAQERAMRAKDERLNKYMDRCEKLMTILKVRPEFAFCVLCVC